MSDANLQTVQALLEKSIALDGTIAEAHCSLAISTPASISMKSRSQSMYGQSN